jgi:hypothetical protein
LADQLTRVLREEPWCHMDYAKRQVQLPAGVAEFPEFYWAGYLATPGRRREGIQFVTVLMDWADRRGRAWLSRGLGFEVVAAEPSNQFNNRPLFRSGGD